MTPQPTKSSIQGPALSPPSGSAPTQSARTSSGESAQRNGTQSPVAPGTRRVGREQSRDTLAALVLGMALANPARFKDSLTTLEPTAWTQRGQALVAALLAGDADKAAAALSDYGVHRENGEAVTAAILRRLGEVAREIADEREADALHFEVANMAKVCQPEAFRDWLKKRMGGG